ncbi:MAG: guanylate kinase [Christensenellaceae bacterium]|jgi:guanylate kinase|nr:guanylate kinase [Christensenellaceae bacterium]
MQSSKRKGLLLIISGPSGVGKGALCQALMQRNSNIKMSVSCTTRAPRVGEVDGINYFFKSPEEFQQMIEQGAFLEYIHVFGVDYYGTPRTCVEQQRAAGHDIILEIDVQGAMQAKQSCPDAVTIFIAPPSMSTLKTRLIGRGTETQQAIERRFEAAFEELQYMRKYDYIVTNDVLDKAVVQTEQIIAAESLRASRQMDLIESFQGGFSTL